MSNFELFKNPDTSGVSDEPLDLPAALHEANSSGEGNATKKNDQSRCFAQHDTLVQLTASSSWVRPRLGCLESEWSIGARCCIGQHSPGGAFPSLTESGPL